MKKVKVDGVDSVVSKLIGCNNRTCPDIHVVEKREDLRKNCKSGKTCY